MNIMGDLIDHYERLRDRGILPGYGYSKEKVHFAAVLSADGEVVEVQDLRTGKEKKPKLVEVTRPSVRSSGIAPNVFWDKTNYVFGAARNKNTGAVLPAVRGEFEAFRSLHRNILANVEEAHVSAFLKFLSKWDPDDYDGLSHSEDMAGLNVAFKFSDHHQWLHDIPEARDAWEARLNESGNEYSECLATGVFAPIARTHPKIRGVRGAQTSGAVLVASNLKSAESYGKKQGMNSPMSEKAAFAYSSVLNHLLSKDGLNFNVGDMSVVYWAETMEAEKAFGQLVRPPIRKDRDEENPEAVEADYVLYNMSTRGRSFETAFPNIHNANAKVFIMGLSPNAARISVRMRHSAPLHEVCGNIRRHWLDCSLEPKPIQTNDENGQEWTRPHSLWRSLVETAAHRKMENVSPILAGRFLRAVLEGDEYPRTLLSEVVARIRADKRVGYGRAALCRGVLLRMPEKSVHVPPLECDWSVDNPGYLLGGLFGVLEGIQAQSVIGSEGKRIKSTIKDRHYGMASATPALTFPILEKAAKFQKAKMLGTKAAGLGHWYSGQIEHFKSRLGDEFPKRLGLEDQANFAVGYYHWRSPKRNAQTTNIDDDKEK